MTAAMRTDLLESLGIKHVSENGNIDWLDGTNDISELEAGNHDLITGTTEEVSLSSDFENHGQVEYISDTPYPVTIRAIIPNMEQN